MSKVSPFKVNGAKKTVSLETRIDVLEKSLMGLTETVTILHDALAFSMTHIQQDVKSLIVGAPDKRVSMLDYYRASKQPKPEEKVHPPECVCDECVP